jgi:hypothetical protein
VTEPLERDIAAWLRNEPAVANDMGRARTYAAVRATRQRPAWLVPVVEVPRGWPMIIGSLPLLGWLLVAFALTVSLTVAGVLLSDLREEIAPVVDATPTASASPTPSPTRTPSPAPSPSRPPAERFTFQSPLYHYTIELVGNPAAIMPATEAWGALTRWDGLRGEFVDKLGPHLSAISADLTEEMPAETWARAFVPPRVVGTRCRKGGIVMAMDAPKSVWKEVDFNGRSGVMRERCGFLDGVVIAGGRAYLFSLSGPFNLSADSAARAEFLDLIATVEVMD